MKNSAIYARTARLEHTSSKGTIAGQVNSLKEKIKEDGNMLTSSYCDAGKDNINKRPALTKMLKDAQSGKFDALYIENLNRLSRDYSQLEKLIINLNNYGVRVITLDGQQLDTPENITLNLASIYTKIMAERMKRVRSFKKTRINK